MLGAGAGGACRLGGALTAPGQGGRELGRLKCESRGGTGCPVGDAALPGRGEPCRGRAEGCGARTPVRGRGPAGAGVPFLLCAAAACPSAMTVAVVTWTPNGAFERVLPAAQSPSSPRSAGGPARSALFLRATRLAPSRPFAFPATRSFPLQVVGFPWGGPWPSDSRPHIVSEPHAAGGTLTRAVSGRRLLPAHRPLAARPPPDTPWTHVCPLPPP